MDSKSDFPKLLRDYRKENGLTQRSLAAKLGLSYNSVVDYENGRSIPSPQSREVIAQKTGIDISRIPQGKRGAKTAFSPLTEQEQLFAEQQHDIVVKYLLHNKHIIHQTAETSSPAAGCSSAGNDRPALMMAGQSIKNRASAETTTSLHGISFLLTARLHLKYIRALCFCQVKILQKGEITLTYLSTAEVAEIKGCTPRYVRQLVQNGNRRWQLQELKTTDISLNDIRMIFPVLDGQVKELEFLKAVSNSKLGLRGAVRLFTKAYSINKYDFKGLVETAKITGANIEGAEKAVRA